MKNAYLALIIAAIICGAGAVKAAETVYVVETTDLMKRKTYDIMSAEKWHELQKTVAAEARVFQRALDVVRKDWENVDKPTPGEKPAAGTHLPPPVPFPGGLLATRKVEEKGEFTDSKKADKKREALENQAIEEQKKAEDASAKRYDSIKDQKRKDARKAADQERMAAAERVSATLQSKIDELVKAAATPASDTAPATGGAGEAKPAAAAAK